MKPCTSKYGFCTVLYDTAHTWFQTKTINFSQLKSSFTEPLFLNSLQTMFSPELRRHFMTTQYMHNISKITLSGQSVLKSTDRMKILFETGWKYCLICMQQNTENCTYYIHYLSTCKNSWATQYIFMNSDVTALQQICQHIPILVKMIN